MTGSFPLDGRTALVTGAARRLGRAIALALARQGAPVIIHYHASEDAAQATCAEIDRAGGQALALQVDLGSPEGAQMLARRCLEACGSVPILINNASAFSHSCLQDVTGEDLEASLRLHAHAPLVLSRTLMSALPDGQVGRVVNLLDAYLHTHQRTHVAYNLGKRTLHALTGMLALELAPQVTVNAVSPGVILPPPGESEEALEPLLERVPMQRPGQVAEVVEAVLYLLRAGYTTGQTLYVDGGARLRPDTLP